MRIIQATVSKMLKSMMQVYVKESDKAVEFYQKVFNAEILCQLNIAIRGLKNGLNK